MFYQSSKEGIDIECNDTIFQLNTAAALAAAATAGQMSDAIINTAAASEDASLSSQETISIR